MHGKVLDVSEGKPKAGQKVIVFTQNNPRTANQLWHMEKVGDGQFFYVVSAMDPNLVLDVKGGNGEPGGELIIYTKNNPPTQNQLFRWEGEYLVSAGGNLCLDIKGSVQDDGAAVIMWNPGNTENQRWEMY